MSEHLYSHMSQDSKEQIAQKLGFADTLKREGFAGITSRDCGNMVKMAIELEENNVPGKSMT